jgi:OTU domain-containing protein 3
MFGLMIKDVTGDGNCLFRAVADQLYGQPERHDEIRARTTDFLDQNADGFAPFVVDMPFDRYVNEMRRNGTWGGNLELQAMSVLLDCNIVVHQLSLPRYELLNHTPVDKFRTIHLSYHDGEHYASVRPFGVFSGVPDSIPLQPKLLEQYVAGSSAAAARKRREDEKPITRDERLIMDSTGVDIEIVRNSMQDLDGNVEYVIEYLIAIQNPEAASEDWKKQHPSSSSSAKSSGKEEQQQEQQQSTSSSTMTTTTTPTTPTPTPMTTESTPTADAEKVNSMPVAPALPSIDTLRKQLDTIAEQQKIVESQIEFEEASGAVSVSLLHQLEQLKSERMALQLQLNDTFDDKRLDQDMEKAIRLSKESTSTSVTTTTSSKDESGSRKERRKEKHRQAVVARNEDQDHQSNPSRKPTLNKEQRELQELMSKTNLSNGERKRLNQLKKKFHDSESDSSRTKSRHSEATNDSEDISEKIANDLGSVRI